MKNHYNILGVQYNASVKTINEAYKKLALKFHPDVNPGDAFYSERFNDINEANRLLSDKDEREQFDFNIRMYDDAYETLKLQHEEDQFKRTDRRNAYQKSRKRSRILWFVGLFCIVLTGLLFFLNDNDGNVAEAQTTFAIHAESQVDEKAAAAEQVLPTTVKLGMDALAVSDDMGSSATTSNKELSVSTKMSTAKNKAKENLSGRKLTSSETSSILDNLATKDKTKGVRILQSNQSNIAKDFAIANVLQKHGYFIAGRNIIYDETNGIRILEEKDCLKVVIGRVSAN